MVLHPRSPLKVVTNQEVMVHSMKSKQKIDLSEFCVMSPSARRLQELASVNIHPHDNQEPNTYRKKLKVQNPQSSNPWNVIKQKLREFNINLFTPLPETNSPIQQLAILKEQTILEELEELLTNVDIKSISYPDYISHEDISMVKYIIDTKFHKKLAYSSQKRANTSLFVYKKPTIRKLQSQNNNVAIIEKDVAVNVPELASKGRDMFIQELRLRRLDSAGGIRKNMLWEVAQSVKKDVPSIPISDGDGGVYAMPNTDGKHLAMFKPMEEEKFVREGLQPGEGAVREEAAYVLDSRYGGYSKVPPTAVAKLHVSGTTKQGSVQRYMQSKKGSLEDLAMPRHIDEAVAFVPIDEIHKIGILDVRLFNTDRHDGNVLLIGDKAPYSLVPIDHGCILPSWFHLAEARFDWDSFPQSECPFSNELMEHIRAFDSARDAIALRKLGIREECITTMKVCTLVLQVAAQHGKTLNWIAAFMQRSGCLDKPSKLENVIDSVCQSLDIPFRFIMNEYNEATGIIEPSLVSRRPPATFYQHLETKLIESCR